jgi:hypothetical protein
MQGLYDEDTASAFNKSLQDGDAKLEAAAVEKGRKKKEAKQLTTKLSSSKKKKNRGASGGVKKCHSCGGSSHLQRDCPKNKTPSK